MSTRTHYCSRCLTTFQEDLEACPNLGCQRNRSEGGWGQLLKEGEILDRHYRVLRRVAIGGAGVTYLARELDAQGELSGDKLAIKVLYAQRDQGAYLQRLATEAQILLQLNNPHIVDIRGFVQRAGHSPYLVTRFEEGGSLLDHLRRVGSVPLHEVAAMGVQLCEALAKAHAQGVIHRDLKPENILLTCEPASGEIPELKLTDFGIAKVHGGLNTNLTRVGAFVGTPQYAAPEQFQGLPLSPAADVYSVAAVLLFCVTLRPVLGEIDMGRPDEMLASLAEAIPPAMGPEAGPLSAGFNTFLRATMAFDPADRASISGAGEMLADLVAGRPVRAPERLVESSRTAVPDVAPELEQVRSSPSSDDTFEGILSQNGGAPALGTAAHPRQAPVAAGGSGLTEMDSEPGSEPPASPPRSSSRTGLLAGFLGVLLLALCAGGLPLAAWWESPSNIPDAVWSVFPAPQVLAVDAPEAQRLRQSLLAQKPRMIAGCAGSGKVRFNIVLESNGKVRQLLDLQANDPDLARCVARNTRELQFDWRHGRAVMLALEMDL